jgi:signal recognition particle subunit SRP68
VLGRLSEAEEGARGEARAFSWMDEEVDPRVRFCAYKLGRKDAHDVKGIVDEFQGQELEELLEEFEAKEIVEALKVAAAEQENGAEGKRKSGEVEWLGERIGFRNAEGVGVMEKVGKAVSKLEELTAKKERENKVEGGKGKRQQQQQQQGKRGGKMKAYDRVLLELSEGVEKVKQIREDAEVTQQLSFPSLTIFFSSTLLLTRNPLASASFLTRQNSNSSTNAGSSSSTGQPDSLSLLQDYLTHSLLTHRIARDLLLIRSQLHPFSSSRPTRRAAPSYTNITFSSSKGDGGEEKAAMDEKEMRVLPIVIKLYDGVIRAWEAVRELGAIERDGEVSEAVEAKVGFFRAKR